MKAIVVLLAAGALASAAMAQSFPGNPADMYVTSDQHSEVYQFERSAPWNHVPGLHAGGALPMVFSNSAQIGGNFPYLGALCGPTNNFFVGGFNGLAWINNSNGNGIGMVAGGLRLGPAEGPNGNVVVGGPSGVEEYDSSTGSFVRTINGYGNGANMFAFVGNLMYTTHWKTGGAQVIKQFDFVTGAQIGADISVPFSPQKLVIGPDGALYASALYDAGFEGVYRYNGSGWNLFADTTPLSGTGPHGFAFDPVNYNLYLAMQTGELFRFDGLTGNFLNQANFVPTKLTDVLFHEVVPAPGAFALLGLGALAAARRRR